MPGFDGTGPRRLGPMTGGGRGLCVLKLPAEPDEPIIGLAGRAGWTIRRPPDCEAELTQLRNHARRIEAVLAGIRGRIECLEAGRPQEPDGTQEERESL